MCDPHRLTLLIASIPELIFIFRRITIIVERVATPADLQGFVLDAPFQALIFPAMDCFPFLLYLCWHHPSRSNMIS